MLDRLFQIRAAGSTARREVGAGVTTFLAMSYIVFVNPQILSVTGMDRPALVTVTVLAALFGTLLAGLWARVPFAMAPGMGLNAFFAYTLVLEQKVSWQTALGIVLLSGVCFLVLTLLGVRRLVVEAIPLNLRLAIGAGIGLFILFIGLVNLGVVVDSPATLVTLGRLTRPAALGVAGLLLAFVLEARRVPGALLVSVLGVTAVAILAGLVPLPASLVSLPPSPAPVLWQFDLAGALRWSLVGSIFAFMFVDLFDSVGTIVACAHAGDMVREDGSIRGLDRLLQADALATVAGAMLGTSTTTTYIESGAGIVAGGRTGLASVVTAGCFVLTLFFAPLIGLVPAYATAPALVVVGVQMFRSARLIRFDRPEEAIPAVLAMAAMPLTYSISTGIAVGFVSWVALAVATGRARAVHPVLWAVAALSLLNLTLMVWPR